eukprot:gene10752-22462_t
MFRTIKDARRRVVETVLVAAGASERTVDAQYDLHYLKCLEMTEDMALCANQLSDFLTKQNLYYDSAIQFASTIFKIYEKHNSSDFWPNTHSELYCRPAIELYLENLKIIEAHSKSNIDSILLKDPFKAWKDASSTLAPDIEATHKKREAAGQDYDSYRRRLKDLEQKRDAALAKVHEDIQAKNAEKNALALEEAQNKVNKYEGKLQAAVELYDAINVRAKQSIIESKRVHDALLDDLLHKVISSQDTLFTQASTLLTAAEALTCQCLQTERRGVVREDNNNSNYNDTGKVHNSTTVADSRSGGGSLTQYATTTTTSPSPINSMDVGTVRNSSDGNQRSTSTPTPILATKTLTTPTTNPWDNEDDTGSVGASGKGTPKQTVIALFDHEGRLLEVNANDSSGTGNGTGVTTERVSKEGIFP